MAPPFRYRRWDGTQEPFGRRLDVRDALERLGGDLLQGFGGRAAVQRLQREGFGDVRGLDELLGHARRRREELAREADPSGALSAVAGELDDIVETERAALRGRDDEDSTFDELRLDALPADPGGRIRELSDYDFASPEAGRRFDELVDRLRQEVLDAYLQHLTGSLESVTDEDVAELTDMLADLNRMLEARDRGEPYDFDAFMEQHGHLFPEDPEDLDELLEVLARRMAAMSRLLRSMSPRQRDQLLELARSVFDDLDLELQLSRLGDNLRDVLPQLDWQGDPDGLSGDGMPGERPGAGPPTPLSAAVDAMERIGELDELIETLGGGYAGARLEDVDEESLRRHLGEDAVRDLEELQRIEQQLEEDGVLDRRSGELELTPRGARLLGERALTRLLDRIRREPSRTTPGARPEPTGQTRPWRFGDTEPIATRRTITNAILRQAGQGGVGPPVSLQPDDFAVQETEVRPRTATALLLDLSFSMPLQGHFVPAKRMALALNALIEGKHRQDSLHLIGFSDYARRMRPAELGAKGFERVYGTNMQHAFLLARRVLAEDPRPTKQVIMVTDGEPTAHLEQGEAIFNWPPVAETLERTLREAMRLARLDITINIFLLESDPGLVDFAERLAELTGGEVLRMTAEEVGEHVLRGYGGRPDGP